METIALKYNNSFASEAGTIEEHSKMLREKGYVWYGKLGTPLSKKNKETIVANKHPKILLVNNKNREYYWAYIDKIEYQPEDDWIPEYYRARKHDFTTWFRIVKIEQTDREILTECRVTSSNRPLNEAMNSMSPFFNISYEGDELQ